jgi:AAA domain
MPRQPVLPKPPAPVEPDPVSVDLAWLNGQEWTVPPEMLPLPSSNGNGDLTGRMFGRGLAAIEAFEADLEGETITEADANRLASLLYGLKSVDAGAEWIEQRSRWVRLVARIPDPDIRFRVVVHWHGGLVYEVPLIENEVAAIRRAVGAVDEDTAGGRRAVVMSAADITPQTLTWLWPGRVAIGALTNLVGLPDVGKTLTYCDLAARLSSGASLPPSPRNLRGLEPGRVLILTNEDSPATTIIPRLDAAGANRTRIELVQMVKDAEGKETLLTFGQDLDVLEAHLKVQHYTLLIIDGHQWLPRSRHQEPQRHRGAQCAGAGRATPNTGSRRCSAVRPLRAEPEVTGSGLHVRALPTSPRSSARPCRRTPWRRPRVPLPAVRVPSPRCAATPPPRQPGTTAGSRAGHRPPRPASGTQRG